MVLTLGGVPSKYKRTTFSPDSYPLGFVEPLLSGAQGVMGRKQERERERERESLLLFSVPHTHCSRHKRYEEEWCRVSLFTVPKTT